MQSEYKKWNKAYILKLFISVGKKQLRYHKKCFRYYILIWKQVKKEINELDTVACTDIYGKLLLKIV